MPEVRTALAMVFVSIVGAATSAGCGPTALLPLRDGPYTCGPIAGSDLNHMTVLRDASGSSVDIFAMVSDGEVATLDLGYHAEVSESIDSFVKQSNSRFNVRIVNEKGGQGKFFTTGDPIDDYGSWGNMLLCVHDG